MKVTIKAYQFMDKLFLTKEEAEKSSEGWDHKESVTTVYLSINKEELEEIQKEENTVAKIELLEIADKMGFETLEEAEQETESENAFIPELRKEDKATIKTFDSLFSYLKTIVEDLTNTHGMTENQIAEYIKKNFDTLLKYSKMSNEEIYNEVMKKNDK